MTRKIGVVGSNMVDLITYVNRMPGPAKRWKPRHLKSAVVAKVPIRPSLLRALAQM